MTNIKLELLPFNDAALMLGTGIVLCVIYFYLLWQTISVLPNVKNKGGFLFLSGTLRLFLIIFVMLVFSGENLTRFLYLFLGFICARSVILRFTKKDLQKRLRAGEFAKADMKKGRTSSPQKKTIKRRRK